MKHLILLSLVIVFNLSSQAQEGGTISGIIKNNEQEVLSKATLEFSNLHKSILTDSAGYFEIRGLQAGNHLLYITMVGYEPFYQKIRLDSGEIKNLQITLESKASSLNEVVVTGTLKEVKRIESPVPVEVYSAQFFKKNPTPNIFEALHNVNGVRPQLNCNICNTGDIHINGLEGPYTMVLIDGMPIVSSLSSVYGLSGIPNSLVERIEIVKGPASSLYGSEAVGGLINIITKKPNNAPLFSADAFSTTWRELNTDLSVKLNAGSKATVLTGINYFNYDNVVDDNKDGFTDVTLQHRISVFQKWNFERNNYKVFSLAARYFYEDRWGGDTRWKKIFRGGDEIYGESIYTQRWELIGNYQLPVKEKMLLSFSYNDHDQDSRYGTTSYIAKQRIAFSQLTWDKTFQKHDLLAGAALRYTYYDDNTPATATADTVKQQNMPDKIWLPGLFVQDEITLSKNHKLLLGFRYDHNSIHGSIYTPRFAYKWSINEENIMRLNAGTGFRVVNLFTEDHAALTGARKVVVEENLKPEKTYNVNLNYLKKLYSNNGHSFHFDVSTWYTYFKNRIIPDFETDPTKILYNNLDGYAVSKGISLNIDMAFANGLKILAGTTIQDVSTIEDGSKEQQMLTEKIAGTWAVSYKIQRLKLGFDYTGSIYGPMRLPLLSEFDPRKPMSPTWSLQNIQVVFTGWKGVEIYGGIKNLLNFTPDKGNPFLIARAHDPFNKDVEYDGDGKVLRTANNPYSLIFDPTYVYAPNQGRRGFLGIRVTVK
jgi:outer membrane receptor for ferrienterochelin and colicins